MNIGNGFISSDISTAIQEIENRIRGSEIRLLDFPSPEYLKYYISNKGEVYGIQQYKDFTLTNKKRIFKNKKGHFVRLNLGHKKETSCYVAEILYKTFIYKNIEKPYEIFFKDGNIYNFQLENLGVKNPTVDFSFVESLGRYSEILIRHFSDILGYLNYKTGLNFEDCKDCASIAFYELCSSWKESGFDNETYFEKTWYKRSLLRAIDFRKRNIRYGESIYLEDGTERFNEEPFLPEIEKPLNRLNHSRVAMFIEKRMLGYSNTEIAKKEEISSSSVRSDVCRGLSFLKDFYRKDIQIYRI